MSGLRIIQRSLLFMNKNELWREILKELSPFRKTYFFFYFIFIITLIGISLPIENYVGMTPKSRSEFLGVQHKILFDLTFITTILSSLWFLMIFYWKGVSKNITKGILEINNQRGEQKINKISAKRSRWVLLIMYLSICYFFLSTPSTSVKYNWMNQGNVYFDFLFIYLICVGFFLLTIILIIYSELVKNVK